MTDLIVEQATNKQLIAKLGELVNAVHTVLGSYYDDNGVPLDTAINNLQNIFTSVKTTANAAYPESQFLLTAVPDKEIQP